MADLRIVDAPLLLTVKGTEKLPTGGEGNFSVSIDQVADFAKLKWTLATEGYVNTVANGVRSELDLHTNNLNNPHQVTKDQVGLGNVDNTADVDKPIGSATQAALTTLTQNKAEKTYVDTQLNSKADKATTYTKTESDSLVSVKSDTSYVNTKYSSHIKTFLNTGTALSNTVNGEYFFVISNDSEKVEDLYLNVNGVATNQNKSELSSLLQHNSILGRDVTGAHQATSIETASGVNQQEINDFGGAKWRNKPLGYDVGSTVKLENGDIVKSTTPNNTINPNVDMTGWVKNGEYFVRSITELLGIGTAISGNIANVLSYNSPILAEVSPYRGGGRFVYDATKSAVNDGILVLNGWVRVKNYTEVDPYMAGCVGDGVFDDSDNFQKLITVSKGSFTIGSTGFFLITKPVGFPTNLLQSIGDGTVGENRAYKMKVTGYGATILVKSAEAIFTSYRSLATPDSTSDLYTGKIEFNGLKFRGDSVASVVFNGDRLYNTKVTGCEFIRCTKVLHSYRPRGIDPLGYTQSFSMIKNDFLLCTRIVDAKRAYNFRFIENDCEANFGGIYIDGDGDPALNACRINDNLFEGGGLFAKLGAMLGCSIKGNYLEGNNQYDAASLKCHIYMMRVGTGGYTSGCVIEGNAFQAVQAQKTDVDWADIKYSTAISTSQDTIAQPILLANWSNSYSLVSKNTITTQMGNGSANLQRSGIPELHVQKRVDYKIKQQTFVSSTYLVGGVHTIAEIDVSQVKAIASQSSRAQTADLNILLQCVSASGVPVGAAVVKVSLIVQGDEFAGTGAVNDVYVGAVLSSFAEIPEGSPINSSGDVFKSHFTSPSLSISRSADKYQLNLSGYATKSNPTYGVATQIRSSCTLIGFGFNAGVNLLPQLKLS